MTILTRFGSFSDANASTTLLFGRTKCATCFESQTLFRNYRPNGNDGPRSYGPFRQRIWNTGSRPPSAEVDMHVMLDSLVDSQWIMRPGSTFVGPPCSLVSRHEQIVICRGGCTVRCWK